MRRLILACLICFWGSAAFADSLDPALEARAQVIGHQLRCVVCQNQSIEESEATLAQDMRRLVRARLKAGDSNADIINFMQDRYGDYVLLKPPVQTNTYLLWFAPFAAVAIGLFWFIRARRRDELEPLSEAERAKLDVILNGDSL